MAADAGSGDRRHIPTWNGNAAKWESFRDEIRVWRLGENLNVKYSMAARLLWIVRSRANDVHDHGC